jgi:hypothetical protein
VLWAYAPEYDDEELAGAVVDVLDSSVIAMLTGDVLVTEGWSGDDLLVGPVEQLLQLQLDDDDEVDEEVDEEVDDVVDDEHEDHHDHDGPAARDLTEVLA